ncbi:Pentatricopeptide repeat-containing protein [Glycine soja]|uniref:Pentatricopeptide repeat-containing protein n=1 Tax=Glycine soja TaxID=3848 RepID=A0A0B2NTH7_GLYSO|nr:Pentatricopeptide repeat-containing protein [Glycine soja]
MLAGTIATTTRRISTSPFSRRLKQTENEIVQMLRLPDSHEGNHHNIPMKGGQAKGCEILKIGVEVSVKVQFFKWAGKRRNFEHDSTTYMALIRCLDEHRMFGEVWKTIQDMVNRALSVFYQVKGRKGRPTVSTYNSVILMLMQEGHHEKVHELYNEMCSEGHCFPDTVTYSALTSAFAKLNRDDSAIRLVEEAFGLVEEMRAWRCLPTVFTHTEFIRGMGKSGRVEDAYMIYKNMLKDGCKPDVILMNNLINILGRSDCLRDAIKLFDEMKLLNCAPNVVTYNTIIKSLFEAKASPSEASSWFERMKKDGIFPSSFTSSILIDGYSKTNQVEKALLLLEEMDEKGFPPCPAAYCSLINTLGVAKRYDVANELSQELKENCRCSSARVYTVMIKHFGKCGRLNEAINLFNEMKTLGCTRCLCVKCSHDWNGVPRRALEMFTKMKNSTNKPDAVSYDTILGCLSRAGLFEEAAKLMQEMGSKGFQYDLIAYSSVIEAVGKVDDCKKVVMRAIWFYLLE